MTIGYKDAYDAIASDIAYNNQFTNSAIAIYNLLDSIDAENTLIQSGQHSLLDKMPGLISNLLGNVAICLSNFLTTFLSKEQQDCYITGDCNLDSIVSLELLTYYNTLQKIRLYAKSINGTINAQPSLPDIRYTASSSDYTLTEDEFDNDNSVSIQNATGFYYITVMDGDSSRIIAQRELKDQELYTQILSINDITESQFIDGELVGTEIKIPYIGSGLARDEDNLVYESDMNDSSAFLYGSDIAEDSEGSFIISGTGDIGSVSGVDNAIQNIERRTNNAKGSFSVFSPNMGTIAIDDGNAPMLVKIDRYLQDQLGQILADPRVESASMQMEKLEFTGESISVPTTVYFIGGETRGTTISG